jgi:cytochrome c oxidase cbb3-type subunit 2
MNYGPLLFLGILLTLASSWVGLVLLPNQQLGGLKPFVSTNDVGVVTYYPEERPGEAQKGAELYRSLGCIYCHSQQVRPEGFGADQDRGWGRRRTVSRDYIFDKTVQLGTMRTGPDLTNIGVRQPSYEWHYAHFYNPQITSRGSTMPPYRFLFEVRPVGPFGPSPDALQIPQEFHPGEGLEVIPKPEAKHLVEYMRSLRANVPLPEAGLRAAEAEADNEEDDQ